MPAPGVTWWGTMDDVLLLRADVAWGCGLSLLALAGCVFGVLGLDPGQPGATGSRGTPAPLARTAPGGTRGCRTRTRTHNQARAAAGADMGRSAASRAGTGRAARRASPVARKTVRPRASAHPALGRVARRRRPAAGGRVPGAHGGRARLARPGPALRPGRGLRRRVDRRRRMDPAFGRHRPALGRHGHPRLGGWRRRRAVRRRLRRRSALRPRLRPGRPAPAWRGRGHGAAAVAPLRAARRRDRVGRVLHHARSGVEQRSLPARPVRLPPVRVRRELGRRPLDRLDLARLGGRSRRGRLGRLCRRC